MFFNASTNLLAGCSSDDDTTSAGGDALFPCRPGMGTVESTLTALTCFPRRPRASLPAPPHTVLNPCLAMDHGFALGPAGLRVGFSRMEGVRSGERRGAEHDAGCEGTTVLERADADKEPRITNGVDPIRLLELAGRGEGGGEGSCPNGRSRTEESDDRTDEGGDPTKVLGLVGMREGGEEASSSHQNGLIDDNDDRTDDGADPKRALGLVEMGERGGEADLGAAWAGDGAVSTSSDWGRGGRGLSCLLAQASGISK
jgi:hypothetical protein